MSFSITLTRPALLPATYTPVIKDNKEASARIGLYGNLAQRPMIRLELARTVSSQNDTVLVYVNQNCRVWLICQTARFLLHHH